MSFSGTPLGQGRRLDHHTFHGKPASNGSAPPLSYAYGAPALGSRSPPKPVSPSRDRIRDAQEENNDEPALARFARYKQQREKTDSELNPTKWPYRDTTVNVANAFIQAASDMNTTHSNPHSNSWASGSNKAPLPRSTSVEYESSLPAPNKRLPPPPDKLGRAPTSSFRKPPVKSNSSLVVPDSEGEGDSISAGLNDRAKSPMDFGRQGLAMARNALGAAAFYVRQHSREPENTSGEHATNGANNSSETSYDYAQEEKEYQASKKISAIQRKNRISLDNKAYKPSRESEDEVSDYTDDDGKKKRRKKGKKGPMGGPLTTLPMVGTDKRRRKKGQGTKGAGQDEEAGSGDDDQSMELQSTQQRTSVTRTSVPPISRASARDTSRYEPEDSMTTQGLDSIPEIDEPMELVEHPVQQSSQRRARSKTPASQSRTPSFSIGGLLGSIVHVILKLSLSLVSGLFSIFSMVTFLSGQIFGRAFDMFLRRPLAWVRSPGSFSTYLVPAIILLLSWYMLQHIPLTSYIPSVSFPGRSSTVYQPPVAPPANVVELTDRLLLLEKAIQGLSVDTELTRAKIDNWIQGTSDIPARLNGLEGRLAAEAKRVLDIDSKARDAVSLSINTVKADIELLQSQLEAQRKQYENTQKKPSVVSDENARAKLKSLEDNLTIVEREVKEALELSKTASATSQRPASGLVPAWWERVVASKSGLKIKSSDGQDVTGLITHMVDAAVSLMNKDSIGKADYALFTGGARVIPQLTSPVLELKPPGTGFTWKGLWSGNGGYVGRSPVTALHYDTQNGQCWPFAGQSGRLGVALAAPVHVEEITLDHLAKEVAFDMRSAPRQVEVWGMVEGTDNIEKIKAWKDEVIARREAGEEVSTVLDVAYPPELGKTPEFIRLASFTYNIHSSNNIQTFPVDPEIKNLNVDFGIVVLRVLSNWGREEHTCIYRFRVHGHPIIEPPPTHSEIHEKDNS